VKKGKGGNIDQMNNDKVNQTTYSRDTYMITFTTCGIYTTRINVLGENGTKNGKGGNYSEDDKIERMEEMGNWIYGSRNGSDYASNNEDWR